MRLYSCYQFIGKWAVGMFSYMKLHSWLAAQLETESVSFVSKPRVNFLS